LYKQRKHPLALSIAIAIAGLGQVDASMAIRDKGQLGGVETSIQEGVADLRHRVSTLQDQNADLAHQITILNQELASVQQQHEAEIRGWAAALKRAKKERVFLFSSAEGDVGTQLDLPITTPTGEWFINFETYQSEEKALERLRTIKEALVPINIGVSQGFVDGQIVYRVRSAGYETRNATDKAVKWINQHLSDPSLWIGKLDDGAPSQEPLVDLPPPKRELRYVVFVGDYTDEDRANAVARAFNDNGIVAEAKRFKLANGTVYKVFIPDLNDKDDAEAVLSSLQRTGSFTNAKILKSFNRID